MISVSYGTADARRQLVPLTIAVMLCALGGGGVAAAREWLAGTWGQPVAATASGAPSRTYDIETDQFRLEVQETIGQGRVPLTVTPGTAVEYVLDYDTVYVRQGSDERALRLIKRTPKLRHYAAAGAGHYIKMVMAGGTQLTLEDGSAWDLDPTGQDRTIHWEPLAGIIVTSEEDQTENGFNYFLNNTDNDEGVLAKLRPAP